MQGKAGAGGFVPIGLAIYRVKIEAERFRLGFSVVSLVDRNSFHRRSAAEIADLSGAAGGRRTEPVAADRSRLRRRRFCRARGCFRQASFAGNF